jgi:hypothetical protein
VRLVGRTLGVVLHPVHGGTGNGAQSGRLDLLGRVAGERGLTGMSTATAVAAGAAGASPSAVWKWRFPR